MRYSLYLLKFPFFLCWRENKLTCNLCVEMSVYGPCTNSLCVTSDNMTLFLMVVSGYFYSCFEKGCRKKCARDNPER